MSLNAFKEFLIRHLRDGGKRLLYVTTVDKKGKARVSKLDLDDPDPAIRNYANNIAREMRMAYEEEQRRHQEREQSTRNIKDIEYKLMTTREKAFYHAFNFGDDPCSFFPIVSCIITTAVLFGFVRHLGIGGGSK